MTFAQCKDELYLWASTQRTRHRAVWIITRAAHAAEATPSRWVNEVKRAAVNLSVLLLRPELHHYRRLTLHRLFTRRQIAAFTLWLESVLNFAPPQMLLGCFYAVSCFEIKCLSILPQHSSSSGAPSGPSGDDKICVLEALREPRLGRKTDNMWAVVTLNWSHAHSLTWWPRQSYFI